MAREQGPFAGAGGISLQEKPHTNGNGNGHFPLTPFEQYKLIQTFYEQGIFSTREWKLIREPSQGINGYATNPEPKQR